MPLKTMIIGLGLDIVELDRISQSYAKFGAQFTQKILTPHELANMPKNAVPYLAARFAAKEAGVKALGTGFSQGIGFKDLEVRKHSSGRPELVLYARALQIFQQLQADSIHISLTHGRDVAAAVVVLEKL